MSAGAQVDPYAAYGGKTIGPATDPYAAYGGSTIAPPDFTSNPNGEGTYKMVGPQGQNIMVPFSKVRGAQDSQFQVIGGDAARYQKDAANLPQNRGVLSSFAQGTGVPAVVGMVKNAVMHPQDTADTVGGFVHDVAQAAMHPNDDTAASSTNPITQTLRGIGRNAVQQGQKALADYRQNGLTRDNIGEWLQATPIVGPQMQEAKQQYDAGNHAGAFATLAGLGAGLVAPEAIKGMPSAVGTAGDRLVSSAAGQMDRFLNGGDALPVDQYGKPVYDSPGKAVLEQGPGTSLSASRPSMIAKAQQAMDQAGPQVEDAVTNSGARFDLPTLRNAVDGVLDKYRQQLNGPAGRTSLLPALDDLRDSFGPALDMNGTITAKGLWDGLRTMDKNINWAHTDALDAVPRQAAKEIRGALSGQLKAGIPDAAEAIGNYRNLADARDLAFENQAATSKAGIVTRGVTDLLGAAIGHHFGGEPGFVAGGLGAEGVQKLFASPFAQTGKATAKYAVGSATQSAADVAKGVPLPTRAVAPLRFTPTFGAGITDTRADVKDPNSDPNQDGERGNQEQSQGTPRSSGDSIPPPLAINGDAGYGAGGGSVSSRWTQDGANRLKAHLAQDSSSGLTAGDVDALAQTRKGKSLLMRAGSMPIGSGMLKQLAKQLASLK